MNKYSKKTNKNKNDEVYEVVKRDTGRMIKRVRGKRKASKAQKRITKKK